MALEMLAIRSFTGVEGYIKRGQKFLVATQARYDDLIKKEVAQSTDTPLDPPLPEISAEEKRFTNIEEGIQGLNVLLSEKLNLADISESGRKIKIVACVIRNDGSGWRFIESANGDSKHEKLNSASVTADTVQITLNFAFNAKNVISFICAPDETFASEGYLTGASVGTSVANIRISKAPQVIGGYVSYNGTEWVVAGNSGVTVNGFANGILTLAHRNVGGTDYLGSVTGRGGKYKTELGSMSGTTTNIEFYDLTGKPVTAPAADMKFFFTRSDKGGLLNPQTVINAGGNIWCLGVFEI